MSELTSDSSDVLGAVCIDRTLNGGLLPVVGGPVTIINVDSKGDLQVNLGLVDGLEDEAGKVTVRAVSPDALRSQS